MSWETNEREKKKKLQNVFTLDLLVFLIEMFIVKLYMLLHLIGNLHTFRLQYKRFLN